MRLSADAEIHSCFESDFLQQPAVSNDRNET